MQLKYSVLQYINYSSSSSRNIKHVRFAVITSLLQPGLSRAWASVSDDEMSNSTVNLSDLLLTVTTADKWQPWSSVYEPD